MQVKRDSNVSILPMGDASLMKAGGGIVAAYNAQAMVSPLEPGAGEGTGLVITAAEVVCEANDSGQLTPMLEQAEEMIGDRAEATLADAGYHSGANLESCAQREQQVIMPESQHKALEHPYHKDRFATMSRWIATPVPWARYCASPDSSVPGERSCVCTEPPEPSARCVRPSGSAPRMGVMGVGWR